MPTKHVVKQYRIPAYYHVYNRAAGERKLFRDDEDRAFFLQLLAQHLSETIPSEGEEVRTYDVEVVAFCLMGTHFHLLLYQEVEEYAIEGYMRSVSTRYSMYYNKKYRSKGHVFQSSYRASWINSEAYLAHITRYIHLNPQGYMTYRWSSYQHYIGTDSIDWLHAEHIGISPKKYVEFVRDAAYVDRRKIKSEIVQFLAN